MRPSVLLAHCHILLLGTVFFLPCNFRAVTHGKPRQWCGGDGDGDSQVGYSREEAVVGLVFDRLG